MKMKKIVYAFVLAHFLPVLGLAKNLNDLKSIAYIGDSLTEGLGVSKDQAYPQVVENLLKKKGIKITTINAGVSGATSASALATAKWVSRSQPSLYILALGANDGLRGLPVAQLRKNLSETIEFLKAQKGAQVLLLGMRAPPNMGKQYVKEFEAVYPQLKKQYDIPWVPFMLEGVAAKKEFNQKDGIHPNVKGHAVMGQLVFKHIEDFYRNTKGEVNP